MVTPIILGVTLGGTAVLALGWWGIRWLWKYVVATIFRHL